MNFSIFAHPPPGGLPSVASSGLGYRLNFYNTSYNTNGTFAMLLVMMALMMGLNALMVLVERYALCWRAEITTALQPY
jgi:ABC-type nitrate/sulfonate/bicarbonate transport system permease component